MTDSYVAYSCYDRHIILPQKPSKVALRIRSGHRYIEGQLEPMLCFSHRRGIDNSSTQSKPVKLIILSKTPNSIVRLARSEEACSMDFMVCSLALSVLLQELRSWHREQLSSLLH